MPFHLEFYNARRQNKVSGNHKRAFGSGLFHSTRVRFAVDSVFWSIIIISDNSLVNTARPFPSPPAPVVCEESQPGPIDSSVVCSICAIRRRRIRTVRKVFIGALASLMLAGAIGAVSGSPINAENGAVVIVGEGSAPIPFAPPTEIESSDQPTLGK